MEYQYENRRASKTKPISQGAGSTDQPDVQIRGVTLTTNMLGCWMLTKGPQFRITEWRA